MKPTHSLREADTREAKASLRRDMGRARRALAPDERVRASRAACQHLLALPQVASSAVVAVYVAKGAELDPGDAAAALIARGVVVVHPRALVRESGERGTEHLLSFHRVPDLAELVRSPFGVLEPRPEHPVMPLDRIDAIVVPGLAFDARGGRLGWGKGYYDVTLARTRALRVGFAYHSQLVPRVPVHDHDAPMDVLVTEAGISRISERARAPLSLAPPEP